MDEAAVPSSPPLVPRYRAVSPTSSEPPLFSSDDPPDEADVANYQSPRYRRKRVGPWWEVERDSGMKPPQRKKTKMTRNFDSGVWMNSDSSHNSDDTALSSSLALLHDSIDDDDELLPLSPEEEIETIAIESALYRKVQEYLDKNCTRYDFSAMGLRDADLHCLSSLDQIIAIPPDPPGIEAPAEGQYRSMVPELQMFLDQNFLRRLSPELFSLQNLTSLTLRHNDLVHIPPQISQLCNLQSLDIAHNKIRWLPLDIVRMLPPHGGILSLCIFGNPLIQADIFNGPYNGFAVQEEFEKRQEKEGRGTYNPWQWAKPKAWAVKRNEIYMSDYQPPAHHSLPAPYQKRLHKDDLEDMPRLLGSTPVTYFDSWGRLLSGCTFAQDAEIVIQTKQGVYGMPDVWIEPSSRSTVPSLAQLSLTRALCPLSGGTPELIREMLKETNSLVNQAELGLEQAELNMHYCFRSVINCDICGRECCQAAAQWIEVWKLGEFGDDCLPIMMQACTWGCVPKEAASKPAGPRWEV